MTTYSLNVTKRVAYSIFNINIDTIQTIDNIQNIELTTLVEKKSHYNLFIVFLQKKNVVERPKMGICAHHVNWCDCVFTKVCLLVGWFDMLLRGNPVRSKSSSTSSQLDATGSINTAKIMTEQFGVVWEIFFCCLLFFLLENCFFMLVVMCFIRFFFMFLFYFITLEVSHWHSVVCSVFLSWPFTAIEV